MENDADNIKKVLYTYGEYVARCVFDYCLEHEMYEKCRIIRETLTQCGIDMSTHYTEEDWREEFWKLNSSGNCAISNLDEYYSKALQLMGY